MEKNMGNPQNSIFRYERKFFIQNMDRRIVENIVLNHPAFFSEIYYQRYINNIYFDFLGFNNFMDNIDGNMFRTKYRVRWYGDMLTLIKNPILELKIKKGLVGTKDSHKLKEFVLEKGIAVQTIKDVITNSSIDELVKLSIREQTPVMLNRYRRKYFETEDKKFRITIDDSQSFYTISNFGSNFLSKFQDNSNIILELKYDKEYESEVENITNKLPFRLTKSSKYARGIELFYC